MHVPNYEVTESDNKLTFTVERSGGSDGNVTVKYTTHNGTAIADHDFEAISNTLTWQDGENDKRDLTITILDDNEVEKPETFTIHLSHTTNGTLGTATASVTIHSEDEEILPGIIQFSPKDNYQVHEKVGKLTVTVERLEGSDGKVTVQYATNSGTALADHDFVAIRDTLIWEDGENGDKTVAITIIDDNEVEESEILTFNLSDVTGGASLGTKEITATIISDDIAEPVVISEVGTPSTTCQYHPKFSIKPAKQDFALNVGDKPITQTFSGGQQTLKIIQPPNGQIVTLLGLSFSEKGSATIQFEAREVGTTYFIIGDECDYQATVNVTVSEKQAPDEIETSLTSCQSVLKVPLKPEQNHIIMNRGDSRVLWFTGGQQKRWLSIPPAGEIVRLESVEFPTEGGAKLTLTATQTGETQLGISDCVSESIVNLTINDKIPSCTSLPTEPQEIKLLEGESPLFKTFTGLSDLIAAKQYARLPLMLEISPDLETH